jgi:1-deoxy-D-xylulose-5-phosphate reductoisomerase
VLNAADEVAVGAFLDGSIKFLDIARVVTSVLETHVVREPVNVEDVADADTEARDLAKQACADLAR